MEVKVFKSREALLFRAPDTPSGLEMTILAIISRYQLLWFISCCFTVSLAINPIRLGRLPEPSATPSGTSANGDTHLPHPDPGPSMDHQSARNYLTDNDDRSSASYSDYSPSPRAQHISDDEFEQLSGDEMESRSSRRRRLPKSYPSDSEASYSPPQSPMSYSGGLSSSEDEMDGSDSSKAERINYFDYFAKQKLMPLPEDEYYHKIQPDIIQAFYNKFSEMLVHKTRGRRDVVTPHKELPFGLVTHALPFPGRPSEVLLPRSSATQTREGWQDLYLKLITSLSERHAKDYKAARVLKTQYRAEQIRLLNWLDKEIFAPYQSLPVLGLSRYSFGSESIDDIKLKPTQIELIKYFSQYHYRSQTEPTVSNLMEAYKKGQQLHQSKRCQDLVDLTSVLSILEMESTGHRRLLNLILNLALWSQSTPPSSPSKLIAGRPFQTRCLALITTTPLILNCFHSLLGKNHLFSLAHATGDMVTE
ncbi:hypothetical protein H4Q26_016488 [Puccinia striiformis f. sp. tritici PST-130]|nr:hypothetical protein H4Q26_016488 [Puccinia striiformis f. sp. tritici PST-130]